MSAPILKTYVDERGNISVRVSRDVQMLTREEADRIEAEYKRMQAENAKLRELAAKMARALGVNSEWCNRDCEREFGCGCEPCPLDQALLELGVEVD